VCAGLHRRHVADVGTPSGRVDAALEALARAAPFRVPPARSGLELVEADRRSRGEHERAVAVGRAGADEIANGVRRRGHRAPTRRTRRRARCKRLGVSADTCGKRSRDGSTSTLSASSSHAGDVTGHSPRAGESRLDTRERLLTRVPRDNHARPEQPLEPQLGPSPARELIELPTLARALAHQTAVAQTIERHERRGIMLRCRSGRRAAQRPRDILRPPRLAGEQREHERTERTSVDHRIQPATTPSCWGAHRV
jgi:hypothetical protein